VSWIATAATYAKIGDKYVNVGQAIKFSQQLNSIDLRQRFDFVSPEPIPRSTAEYIWQDRQDPRRGLGVTHTGFQEKRSGINLPRCPIALMRRDSHRKRRIYHDFGRSAIDVQIFQTTAGVDPRKVLVNIGDTWQIISRASANCGQCQPQLCRRNELGMQVTTKKTSTPKSERGRKGPANWQSHRARH
jgi:hypothetical protein